MKRIKLSYSDVIFYHEDNLNYLTIARICGLINRTMNRGLVYYRACEILGIYKIQLPSLGDLWAFLGTLATPSVPE